MNESFSRIGASSAANVFKTIAGIYRGFVDIEVLSRKSFANFPGEELD